MISPQLEGQEHLFVEEVHQYHVCQHPSCKGNRAFERILQKHGAYEVSRRLMKRESYRLYDRKYPYDSTAKAIQLEDVQDTVGVDHQHIDGIIAKESVDLFKSGLTPRQRAIADMLEMGYKPREIAAKWGLLDSGSIRWHKHQIKRKAEQWYR